MRRRHPLVRLALLAVGLGSIASSSLGPPRRDTVAVSSEPSGALVLVDGRVEGNTPIALELSPDRAYTIVVQHAGVPPFEQLVQPTIAWSALGPAVLNGLGLGLAQVLADWARGRTRRLEPREICARWADGALDAAGAALASQRAGPPAARAGGSSRRSAGLRLPWVGLWSR